MVASNLRMEKMFPELNLHEDRRDGSETEDVLTAI